MARKRGAELAFIATLGSLFVLLAAFALRQVARVVLHRHNLLSFHNGFMLLCLWTSLLRAGYFVGLALGASNLLWAFFTDEFPVLLQLATFSLVVTFFTYILHKPAWKALGKWYLGGWFVCNVALLLCLVLLLLECHEDKDCVSNNEMWNVVYAVVYAILAVCLAFFGLRLAAALHHQGPAVAPELQRRSWAQVLVLTLSVFACFLSRVVYDLAVSFGTWKIRDDKHFGVVSFLLLLVWDIVPTTVVLVFFRHIPKATNSATESFLASREPILNDLDEDDAAMPNGQDVASNHRSVSLSEPPMPMPMHRSWEALSPSYNSHAKLSVTPGSLPGVSLGSSHHSPWHGPVQSDQPQEAARPSHQPQALEQPLVRKL